MQHYRDELLKIGTVFQKEEIDFLELSSAINAYKQIIYGLTNIDIHSDASRQDIHSSNGKAIGTTWAAMCLEDILRTKKFINGVFKAIEKLKRDGKKTIHILYAGTGPFATLLLPVLAQYSSEELKTTLIEINTESFTFMKALIEQLGFDEHVLAYKNEDATKLKIENPETIDIVLSETLQRGLVVEQQVPITINLLKQIPQPILLIPESLALDVCWMNYNVFMNRSIETNEESYCLPIKRLIEINKNSHDNLIFDFNNSDVQILAQEKIELSSNRQQPDYNHLALITRIKVFKDEEILINESGLTLPIFLKIPEEANNTQILTISYKIDEIPGYTLEYS